MKNKEIERITPNYTLLNILSPIGGIEYKGKLHVFYSETEVGPVTKELYRILCGIQFGDVEAPEGWIYTVE